jgi:hypothetical protein
LWCHLRWDNLVGKGATAKGASASQTAAYTSSFVGAPEIHFAREPKWPELAWRNKRPFAGTGSVPEAPEIVTLVGARTLSAPSD